MTDSVEEYDLIIVGAGIAGCAAARAFGSDGRRVLLLERDLSEPDRIVGELLQPGGVNALKQLGLEGKNLFQRVVCDPNLYNRLLRGYGWYSLLWIWCIS